MASNKFYDDNGDLVCNQNPDDDFYDGEDICKPVNLAEEYKILQEKYHQLFCEHRELRDVLEKVRASRPAEIEDGRTVKTINGVKYRAMPLCKNAVPIGTKVYASASGDGRKVASALTHEFVVISPTVVQASSGEKIPHKFGKLNYMVDDSKVITMYLWYDLVKA
jgi:uncharacterized protein YlbG (UPF0298 family)